VKPGPKSTQRRNWEAYRALAAEESAHPNESVKERIIRFREILERQHRALGESGGKTAYYDGKRLHDTGLEPPAPRPRPKNPKGRPRAFWTVGDHGQYIDAVGQYLVYGCVREEIANGHSRNEACRIVCQCLNDDPGFAACTSYLTNGKPLSESTVRNVYLRIHHYFLSKKDRE
jgi:hypothetical protein